jgi:transcriptional regulator with XRE-family HTH domain
MTLKERIKLLCREHGVSMNKLEEDLGFGKGYISKLGTSKPNANKLKQIADYFHVSLDFLLSDNNDTSESTSGLSAADERDIAKDMENIRSKLKSGSNGPLSYDGEPIPEEDAELLLGQIELMIRRLKPINKEKYNPNKNN